MDYRDERDALQGRVQNLEEELAGTRAQAQKTEQLERDLARAQEEIARIHGELKGAQLPPARPRPRSRAIGPVVVACMTALIGAGVAGFALVRPRPQRVTIRSAETNVDPTLASPVEAKSSGARSIRAAWSGKVKSAVGFALAPGAACSIHAQIDSSGASPDLREVEVACGGQPLYRLSDRLEGSSLNSAAVEEMPGTAAGTFRYLLTFEDQGTRTGPRNQVSINTTAGVAAAWKDTMPNFRVELLMDETSADITGAPLFTASAKREPTFRVPVERVGRVSAVTAGAPVAEGAACALHIRPAINGKNDCRVRIRCGDLDLYGARTSGFNQCQYEAGQPSELHDARFTAEDTDPKLDLDLKTGRAVITDQTGTEGETWAATVTFDPPKR